MENYIDDVYGFFRGPCVRLLTAVAWTLFFVVFSQGIATAGKKGPVTAVLPFRIHALESLGHLKQGFQEMVSSRLNRRGLRTVDPKRVNAHPLAFLPLFQRQELVRIGRDLKADWVLSGSLTQIGKRISVDIEVVDTSGKRDPFFIYQVAEEIDHLTEAADRVAVSVDNQIAGVVIVDAVRVEGNQRIEKEAVLAVVKTKPGDRLDEGRLNEDLRNIYKMRFFNDVRMETEDGPRGKEIVFRVTEKPSIGRIKFEGNDEIKDEDLRAEIGIKLYEILDRNRVKQSINRLRDFYRQKGYYNAEIEVKTEEMEENQVLLTYQIKEHDKVYVTKIEFLGNKAFDDDELRDIMETSEKGLFSWITESGYLDKKKLEFDVHKIAAFYHNHGFIRAKVGEPRVTYVEGDGLHITIELEEGEQFGVGAVTVEGDLIEPQEKLLEVVRIGKEKVFNREVVRKDILSLRNRYADVGYAYAEVVPATRENEEKKVVDIIYRISKGKKVRFERINITGNNITRDKVIRRELKAVEGEYFSGKALRRSTQNLHRLGFFEDVEVRTKKGSSDDSMILDVNVKERRTGSFSIGAGYSSVDKAIATFQVSQNNLMGRGQKISTSARLGSRSSQYDIRFIEPWLFDRPLSTSFDLYKWEREYDEYTKDSLGVGLSVGFPLTGLGLDEFTRGSVGYAYDNADISDIADEASQVIKEMEGSNVTSSITIGIRRDSKDRPWNTHEGSVNSLSFEYAGGLLGGDAYFNKYRARSAWYFPVIWDTVFLVQGRWGYVTRRSGGDLPVYQKFRLGGINSVRGFDYASISPVDPSTGDRIGGEKMMVYNLEYRFPLVAEQGIVGLVFFDAGNVFEKDESWTFSGIRRTAGAGIRWYSPIGPLRLEYGKNLDRREGEDSGNWEFTVGGIF